MDQRLPVRIAALALCAALVGCALLGRDNFEQVMGADVGKPADDPSTYRVRHPELRIGAHKLRNGHVEEEYQAGFRNNCRVFYEIDEATRKIVNWRLRQDQPDDDCILPPQPAPAKPAPDKPVPPS